MKGKYNDILFTAIVRFEPAFNWLATSPVSRDFGLPQPASRFALATARWTRGEKKKPTRSRARPAAERRSFGLLFTWVVPPLEAPATEWRNYNGWGNTSRAPLLPSSPPSPRHECGGTGRWLLMPRSAARVILMSGFITSCDHGSVCVFLKPFFSLLNRYFPSCHT